jgi:hypothetical protein
MGAYRGLELSEFESQLRPGRNFGSFDWHARRERGNARRGRRGPRGAGGRRATSKGAGGAS